MKIPILSYHSISDDNCPLSLKINEFEKQLIYLRNNKYESINFDEINPNKEKQIIITFDDGYKDLILNSLPLLKKYNFKAICFIVSDLIGKTNKWDEYDIKVSKKQLMSMSEIKLWIDNGMKIGSHSKNHRKLTIIKKDEMIKEISNSKLDLERLIETKIDVFCYPYGIYDEDVVGEVKKNYKFALTTKRSRYDQKKHTKHLIPRIDMGKPYSKLKLYLKLNTIYEDIKYNDFQICL
tara:strand:- start:576 stop:1286 length:711 start_codon:yes stop_codon:yes gene_type:complete